MLEMFISWHERVLEIPYRLGIRSDYEGGAILILESSCEVESNINSLTKSDLASILHRLWYHVRHLSPKNLTQGGCLSLVKIMLAIADVCTLFYEFYECSLYSNVGSLVYVGSVLFLHTKKLVGFLPGDAGKNWLHNL